MKNPIHKETYRGHGIYWHGGNSYGDETRAFCNSIAEARRRIDDAAAKEEAGKPAHLKHWDAVSPDERAHWRRLSSSTNMGAAELAYDAFLRRGAK